MTWSRKEEVPTCSGDTLPFHSSCVCAKEILAELPV